LAIKNQFPGKSVPSSPNANAKNLPIRMVKMRKTLEKTRKAVKEKHAIMLAVENATTIQMTRPIRKMMTKTNQRLIVPPRTMTHQDPLRITTEMTSIENEVVEMAVLVEVALANVAVYLAAAAREVQEEAEGDLGDTMMTSTCSRVNVPEIS